MRCPGEGIPGRDSLATLVVSENDSEECLGSDEHHFLRRRVFPAGGNRRWQCRWDPASTSPTIDRPSASGWLNRGLTPYRGLCSNPETEIDA